MPEVLKEFQFIVSEESEEERIDKYLNELMDSVSRSYIQKLLSDGNITVNGRNVKSNYKVRQEDDIRIFLPTAITPDIVPENIPLSILYEDDDVIVVNKPKNMVVHPAPGHYNGTLVNALLYHCAGNLSGINGVLRPGIVHRIDKNTTGSVIACKNDFAHASIAQQLKEHSIVRKYHAIVCGNLKEEEGTIHTLIGRHPGDRKKMAVVKSGGKDAITHYRVLQHFEKYTYVECVLETGRTHQIRVHMAYLGHPIVGDAVYAPGRPDCGVKGQCLHAKKIGFVHPRTGEYMEFDSALPDYFATVLQKISPKD